MYKTQEKILKEFGKYTETNDARAFCDERSCGCGWWFYTKAPYYSWDDCTTFHEDTLAELYQQLKLYSKKNDWEGTCAKLSTDK